MQTPSNFDPAPIGGEMLGPVFRDRFVPFAEVSHIVGLGRSYIYGQIKLGNFPKPYKFGSRASRWKLSEVSAWMAARCRAA